MKHNKYILNNDNQTNVILVKKKKKRSLSTVKAPGSQRKATISRNFSLPWARHRAQYYLCIDMFGCLKEGGEQRSWSGHSLLFCCLTWD